MNTEDGDDQREYGLAMSFWIDTDGYSDRDREMFVCGVEFEMIYSRLKRREGWNQPIHNENASRVRMMLGKLGIAYSLKPHQGYQGCETWADLTVLQPEDA